MKPHDPIVMFAASLGLSFTFAIVWVVTMTLTLPPTDGAHGQAPFQDPLVFPVMSCLAFLAGVVVFPLLHLFLRDRPLPMSLAIIAGIVVAEIVVLTPLDPLLGFGGAFFALLVGLVVARRATAM